MEDYLKTEHDEIIAEADMIVSYFWSEIKFYSKGRNFSYLGLRVRKRKIGISLEWYNTIYVKGTKIIIKNYIKKGKSDSYNLNRIKDHKHRRDYELELIDYLEPICSKLRKRSRALSKISYYQWAYEKTKRENQIYSTS